AGVPLAEVITFAISKGLQGLETLSGIPGTIGGAVFGNAGAYGHSMMEVVERVEVLDVSRMSTNSGTNITNVRKWLMNRQCGFGYRESILKKKNWIILRVVLELRPPAGGGDREVLKKKSREIIATREKKYKPGIRCPGSFFKNVLVKDVSKKSLALVDSLKIIDGKIPAGWLLEQVEAKGMREGGIYIADFHGNLFVNDGKGKARDVKALARKLKKKVFDRFGIMLEEEVRYF
ncbi:MAG: UDP-N-acetylmuramate dehydrogenase, partial [Patescibacteria group bacterium]